MTPFHTALILLSLSFLVACGADGVPLPPGGQASTTLNP